MFVERPLDASLLIRRRVVEVGFEAARDVDARLLEALEKVYESYKDRGLVIVGIPANNFAQQAPGTNDEIKKFCSSKYGVTFPMMAKVSVLGDDQTPLYSYLTAKDTDPQFAGDIKWNFTKFLFDRSGKPVARFEPNVKPDDPQVKAAIEGALGQ